MNTESNLSKQISLPQNLFGRSFGRTSNRRILIHTSVSVVILNEPKINNHLSYVLYAVNGFFFRVGNAKVCANKKKQN